MSTCSHRGNRGPQAEAPPTVLLHTGTQTLRVPVEVVRTEDERARGLMFRRELAAQQGMLFIFDQAEIQSFWMKNTYIPLDMIFINEAMQVVGVVENAEPLTTTSRRVRDPSRYVLEVNGGFAKRHGITAGTRVAFEGGTLLGHSR
jgi:hypothetical protein